MRVVFMGPPGAGKGTQAERLARSRGLRHLATGTMLRAEMASGSSLGKTIAELINGGGFVDDAMALRLVADKLQGGYVLDGLPRTLAQARALDDLTEEAPIQAVVRITVDPDELVSRMEARVAADIAAGRAPRADDNPETFRARQATFWELTAPIYAHYDRQGKLLDVDGMRSPDQVTEAIGEALSRIR